MSFYPTHDAIMAEQGSSRVCVHASCNNATLGLNLPFFMETCHSLQFTTNMATYTVLCITDTSAI
jgi:hypothetical protein